VPSALAATAPLKLKTEKISANPKINAKNFFIITFHPHLIILHNNFTKKVIKQSTNFYTLLDDFFILFLFFISYYSPFCPK
jgi:hypothetical protein